MPLTFTYMTTHCVYIYCNWLREKFLYLVHVVHAFFAINRLKKSCPASESLTYHTAGLTLGFISLDKTVHCDNMETALRRLGTISIIINRENPLSL